MIIYPKGQSGFIGGGIKKSKKRKGGRYGK